MNERVPPETYAVDVARRGASRAVCYGARIVGRNVKGVLFVDYVRMVRGHKGVDWSRHLTATDLAYLTKRIAPESWYPMETFERMGIAILVEIAGRNMSLVRQWGRMSVDWLQLEQQGLLVTGDVRETLMRFRVLRQSFFDYPALEIDELTDEEATIDIRYGMAPLAEEAASEQTLGFFEHLVEVAGGLEVAASFASRSWAGDAATKIKLSWHH